MNAEMKSLTESRSMNSANETFPWRSSDAFQRRHIGPRPEQIQQMLQVLGLSSLQELAERTVPSSIHMQKPLPMAAADTEVEVLARLKQIASKNKIFRSFIGLGFHDTVTPPVILRSVLENPGWYTQYTPYQAEISQGRMEALVNFQTLITDLTGLEISNSSLLDEGTAAAEAMMMISRVKGGDRTRFFVSSACHQHVIEVVQGRAEPLGIEIIVGDDTALKQVGEDYFGALVSYPNSDGTIVDYSDVAATLRSRGVSLVVDADLLSLTLLTPPGEWGADAVIGNSQRFGVPLGFGGPHAAFLATRDEFKREMPGRLVGVSKDATGKVAYRLALQTREQHIKRERATSNICTAQVLLAVIAGMYAVYHGPKGLQMIARRIQGRVQLLAKLLQEKGCGVASTRVFDTIKVSPLPGDTVAGISKRAEAAQLNFRSFEDGAVGISLNETTTLEDLVDIAAVLLRDANRDSLRTSLERSSAALSEQRLAEVVPPELRRSSPYLTHPVFNQFHSETEMLRYISRLQSKDLSLTTSMIPLGSCTMKLNATAEMIPVTWPEFGRIHPFVPVEQAAGYAEMLRDLERDLETITGMAAVSLQPNAGSQGEYAGLLVVRAYHRSRGDAHRTICLIPTSAHGTNPASAVMAGMKVVAVKCDENGNVDVADLKLKAKEHEANLAALMVTYPSTHGVFEEAIREICEIIHASGGQVYMDGANLNAQVGLCQPGEFGVDVCHMNLHKTFCIPHGGGGPGMGPIAVQKHLAPFLPGHRFGLPESKTAILPVCSAPWGSASILPIPWVYIKLMGGQGLTEATQVAILNANYIAKRLEGHYDVLYRGKQGMVAHECILDLRQLKRTIGIEVADIAKRLMDYGFHAPTVSFPVVETLMIEPTESESQEELDRFCDALIAIRNEIREVEEGRADRVNNVLKNAPHTADVVCSSEWSFPYTREQAAFPAPWLRQHKFWPSVARVDNAFGDRNLFCTCPPMQ